MEESTKINLQANVFDFAVTELVRQNRESFQPLWTVDSWVKFLIWLGLNCGLASDREAFELFADALGDRLTMRMRKIFFERALGDLHLQILGDPAEGHVLVMPSGPTSSLSHNHVKEALQTVGLFDQVTPDSSKWQTLDAMVVIPRKETQSSS